MAGVDMGNWFPVQGGMKVPRWAAEKAYKTYCRLYGGQSLDRIAERGGFGLIEFVCLYQGKQPNENEPMRNVSIVLGRVLEKEILEMRLVIRQACEDLANVHTDLLQQQGFSKDEAENQDWPEGSSPANTIQWAQALLQEPLSKVSHKERETE